MIRAAIAAIVLFVIGACGAQTPGPEDVVASYFASLGRDPIRSLPLTTDAFHRAHGIGLVTTSEAAAWRDGRQVEVAASERIDKAQVAWLVIQNRSSFALLARGLVVMIEAAQVEGDRATVVVGVSPPQGAAFVQTFRLTREGADAAWRIDAIEQSGITRDNQMSAFVAHPTESARRALEASIRKH